MNDITRYFDRIDSLIRHSFCVDDQVTYQQWTESAGAIEGTLYFYDGSRLEFTEVIRLTGQRMNKQRYRYQYMECLVRTIRMTIVFTMNQTLGDIF